MHKFDDDYYDLDELYDDSEEEDFVYSIDDPIYFSRQ